MINGTLVNTFAIMAGSILGIALKTGFFKTRSEAIINALGLIVLLIGIQGALDQPDILILIVSLALGIVLGELWDIDAKLNQFGQMIETKFTKHQDGRFAQGLVTATLLFGVGAMAIVGSLESGLNHNETILYTKSTLDFVSSIVFASTLGWGVFFSSFAILIYQGVLTLFSVAIAPYLTTILIHDLSVVGSVLIIALGLNMVGATRFKVANLLPSLIVVMVIRGLLFFI